MKFYNNILIGLLAIMYFTTNLYAQDLRQMPMKDYVDYLKDLSLGDHKDNGGDGVLEYRRYFFIFSDKEIRLLDLIENKYNYFTIEAFDTINPSIPNTYEFKYLSTICFDLKLELRECNALKNKMFDIYRMMPNFYQIIKNRMEQLNWKLVDKLPEVDDEGKKIKKNLKKKGLEKIQMAVRSGNSVQIRKGGWIEKYDGYKPMDAINKVATITHEVLYSLRENLGDNNSELSRKINSLLYRGYACDNLKKSFKLLTNRDEDCTKIAYSEQERRWIISHYVNEVIKKDSIKKQAGYFYDRYNKRLPDIDEMKSLYSYITMSYSGHLLYRNRTLEDYGILSEFYLEGVNDPSISKFTTNVNILKKEELIEYLSLLPLRPFARKDNFGKNVGANKKDGIYFSNKMITHCDGLSTFTFKLPKVLRNKKLVLWGTTYMETDNTNVTYLSYKLLQNDVYLSDPDTCIDLVAKDKKKYASIKLVIKNIRKNWPKKKDSISTIARIDFKLNKKNGMMNVSSSYSISSLLNYGVIFYDRISYVKRDLINSNFQKSMFQDK